MDGALIANEVVNWLKKKKKEGALLKLDFQKAYDTINLESLDNVLKEMGFDDKWRRWIKACTSTARISILINGVPCKPFKMKRRIRQGDPLSPYLFVLMAEVLNRALTKAAEIELFQGVHVGSQNVSLSHLQFADDTLLFCEPKLELLINIKKILYSFQSFSGLAVNYDKSGLIVIDKDEDWAVRAAELLKCRLIQLPITYLGVPLGANMKKSTSWQPIIDRIQHRLTSWKASCLSRPGKLVLIKAVLSSLSVYYLSLFKMPKKVATEINKIQRRFLWSGKHERRISTLVKWKVVQRSKKEGGLGVGDLLIKNAALLFKWWWRYACEEGAMWRTVVQSIHEEDHFLLPSKARSSLPGPWRDIKQIALEESPTTKAFFKHLSVKLGGGRRVAFWQDTWADEKPLKIVFPILYSLSTQKNELIVNMGWFEGPLWRWTLAWQRELTIGEQEQLSNLQVLIQKCHPKRDVTDQVVWNRKEEFSTRALVTEACKECDGNVAVDSLASSVWMHTAPPKVEFMTWLALLGKLNTKEMLVRKGILPTEAIMCSFYSVQPESCDHLLLCCPVSWKVWQCIAHDLGIKVEAQSNFRQFYDWWMARKSLNSTRKRFFILSFFVTIWSIWNTRNMMVFQNQRYDHQALCHTIKWRIALWSKA